MKKLLFAAAAASALLVTVPASAQIYAGADPGGVGVRVGPLGVGVGPSYGWGGPYYHSGYYGYAAACGVVRERVVTPSGRVIIRTQSAC